MLLRCPKGEGDHETTALLHHERSGQTTCDEMGTNPGLKHRFPAPHRLLPEGALPRPLAIFAHLLVAAPDVIHQEIQPSLLCLDLRKECFHFCIVPVFTAT